MSYDPYDDMTPFVAKVECPSGKHEDRKVTVAHPSDEFYCTRCGERMQGKINA